MSFVPSLGSPLFEFTAGNSAPLPGDLHMYRRQFLKSCIPAATIVATGCVTSPHFAAPIRLLTYNLHHGEGLDKTVDLQRIAGVIRSASPDLVALQEVDRNATRTGKVDQSNEYIRLTGLHGWYGAAMPFQGGEYGQTILSRWPLENPRVVRLPGTPGREPRIATTAQVRIPNVAVVQWTSLHFDATRDDGDRWLQAGAVLREFESMDLPGFLAGDFNAIPESRVMKRILDPATGWLDTAAQNPAPTVPVEIPRDRIDYILASPKNAWRIVESRTLDDTTASDHRALLTVVQLVPSRVHPTPKKP